MKFRPASSLIRAKLVYLILALLLVSLAAIGISNYALYRIALGQAGDMLGYASKGHALFLEYSIRHQKEEAERNGVPFDMNDALALFREELESGIIFGETGESVLARREGDTIQFFVHNRQKNSGSPVSIPFDSSNAALPMKMALSGTSGTAVAVDYRNVKVLASYEPLPALNMAIVTKMDLAEIREPYIKGAVWLFSVILVVITGGVLAYVKLIAPLIPLLMENEERLMTLINGIDESLLFIDTTGKILMLNEVAAKRLRRPPAEMGGKDVFTFLPPEIAAARRKRLDEALAAGTAIHFDDERDGRHYHNSFFPVMDEKRKKIISVIVHARDITERVKAQNEIVAAKERAEEATRLKDKFILLLSHDLKTPLIGMLGILQLFQKKTENTDDTSLCLDLAIQSNKRMIRMIDQLLDINRIRAGKLQLKCRFCNGAEIVSEAVATVEDMAARKRITIRNMVSERTMVLADPVFLQQVFCNLLTNAVKFSGEGTTVIIRAVSGGEMVFSVEDEGVGIAPEQMKKIFSYHDKTTTRGTKGEAGTGFGLPLSADIMEALNGRLKAEARPEGGTSFMAVLPNPAPRVLVMENSPGSCEALSALMNERGFMVTASTHALKILEMLRAERFDFMLVQLSATKETGAELLRLVANDPSLKGLSLLAIGDSECYARIDNDDRPSAGVIDCGLEAATVIDRIYSVLMGNCHPHKGAMQ